MDSNSNANTDDRDTDNTTMGKTGAHHDKNIQYAVFFSWQVD